MMPIGPLRTGRGAKLKDLLAFAEASAVQKAGGPNTLLFPNAFGRYLREHTFSNFDPFAQSGAAGSRHAGKTGVLQACYISIIEEMDLITNFARPMNNNDLAFNFLTKVLNLNEVEADDASLHVMKAERLLEGMELKSTLESQENRRFLYKEDGKRVNLRRKIFDELKDFERPEDDEDITLGVGGAKPHTQLKSDREAILLTGLPASGKSTVANKLADLYGAYVIDSDFAKRKIPEFGHEFGASIVHEESSLVTFGSIEPQYSEEFNLYEYCIANGYNMIIPKIGSSCESVRKIRDALMDKGYKVHLLVVSLDRQESCRRALYRYLETKRYVPLGLVFDVYANEPTLTYYRVKDDEHWSSVGKLSTLNLREKGPEIVSSINNGPVEVLKRNGVVT